MEKRTLRVLLVEDSPEYARFIKKLLLRAEGDGVDVCCTHRVSTAVARLDTDPFDVVVLDLTLTDSAGLDTFDRVNAAAHGTAIVVMSGIDDEELALEAVHRGAQDYLVKRDIGARLLMRTLRYAVERKRAQEKIRALNAELERRVAERTQELTGANEALARANEELRKLDQMKSAFIDVTSHELRTPVLAIRGMLHVLRRQIPEDDPDLAQAVNAAVRGARRLEAIVARTLEVARAGEFVRRLDKEPVSPAALIEDVLATVGPITKLRDQTVTTILAEGLKPVPAARDLIRDVLLNLVMNAIKFTPNGGHIEVGACQKDGFTEFSVSDNGIGIVKADQPHIFEEFFTTMDARHHSTGRYGFLKRGIGLGLAIVKNFVELHGGRVEMTSEVSKGSTFRVFLPMNNSLGKGENAARISLPDDALLHLPDDNTD
jgi:signal transduction histidine kinase